MKVTLVAMPWAMFNAPSAALGILSAYIKENEPEIPGRARPRKEKQGQGRRWHSANRPHRKRWRRENQRR